MAVFNPPVNPTNDPSYLNYSQGTSKVPALTPESYPSVPSPRSPMTIENNASGIALAGLGDVFSKAVGAADTFIKNDIEKTVTKQVDALRSSVGQDELIARAQVAEASGDATLFDSTTDTRKHGRGLPPGLQNLPETLDKYKAAYDGGYMSDTYFWARASAIAKQVRSQYPGYREEVDALINKKFGTDPANALRRSTMADMEAAIRAGQGKEQDFQKYVTQNEKYISEGTMKKILEGTATQPEVRWEVSARKRQEYSIEQGRQEIAFTKDNREQARTRATDLVNEYANQEINRWLVTVTEPMKKLQGIQAGTLQATPEEKVLLAQSLKDSMAKLDASIMEFVTKPTKDRDGKPVDIYSILGEQGVKDLKGAFKQRMQAYHDAIGVGDFGILLIDKNITDATNNERERRVYTSVLGQSASNIQLMRKIAGESAFQSLLTNKDFAGGTAYTEFLKTANAILGFNAAVGKSNGVQTDADNARRAGMTKPEAEQSLVIQVSNRITDGVNTKIDKDQRVNQLMSVFKPDGGLDTGRMATVNERWTMFNRATQGDVYKAVKELGNADLTQAYQNWTVRSFVGLLKGQVSDVSAQANQDNRFAVSFDPKTNQLSTQADLQALGPAERMAGGSIRNAKLDEAIKNINTGLRAIAPVMKDQGKDVGMEMFTILQSMGLDTRYQQQGREFFYDAVKNAFSSASNVIGDTFRALEPHSQEAIDKANSKYRNPTRGTAP